jgi:phosphomannomutase
MASFSRNNKILVLFDVDGTLTEPREEVEEFMQEFLVKLKSKVVIGVVGGSDLVKQQEQMGKNVINDFDYSFSENGLVAYKNGTLIGKEAIHTYLGEENIKSVVNFVLHYIADLDIPVKRGSLEQA